MLSSLRTGLEIAKILKEHLPEIRESLEILKEIRMRRSRDARVGDLEDSIARLDALDR